ncbi:MAG: phosphopentomutase [Acidobacteriota bacterium]
MPTSKVSDTRHTQRCKPSFDTVVVLVCDSVGCGGAPDAARFGDQGSNTLGHVIERARPALPNLASLGLDRIPGVPALCAASAPTAAFGRMVETAPAKDTMTGHWELMGLVAEGTLPTYPQGFPAAIIRAFEKAVGRRVLGNRAASGTAILRELGAEHIETGALIVYTSADSVFQVAAHEEVVPPQELYEICLQARALLHGEHAVGRVIARPFTGDAADNFRRTAHRRDFSLPPPGSTVLDRLVGAGRTTYGVGKIHDIFAGMGLSGYVKTASNADGVAETCRALREGLAEVVITNLVDFDSLYGHRNDVNGYATALCELDLALPELLATLARGDCLMITADHGCDPTFPGTDHTRECVPLLVVGEAVKPVALGTRSTYADLGRTILENFAIEASIPGTSFLDQITG